MASKGALLTGLVLACLAMMASHQPTSVLGASVLSNIPGMNLIGDLTRGTIGTAVRMVDDALGMASSGIRRGAECLGCQALKRDPDANRTVADIIRSRGFLAEEHDVETEDGYILTMQRIINPLVKDDFRPKMKPIIMQHGLMSSSVDYVINSVNVRPAEWPLASETTTGASDQDELSNNLDDSQEFPNALGFFMANRGYDVFLSNSRGNIYGQRHKNMSSWHPKFWDFTFDEQIKYDLPAVIAYVQQVTNKTKVGYVGHSQGTAMMFGLLSDRPEYADVVEPFVALAPVAYCNNALTPVKYFAVYTPLFEHVNMWFGTSNVAVKYLGPIVCGPDWMKHEVCANIIFLSSGFDAEEFDESRADAYLAHMPSGTSTKNIAHYGQLVLSGRFAHFDHGILGNQMKYGKSRAPDYDLTKIRSKSIAMFIAENDWLASPKDVAHLRTQLKVNPFKVFNITESVPKFNHIDFLYAKHSGTLINKPILEVFKHFD